MPTHDELISELARQLAIFNERMDQSVKAQEKICDKLTNGITDKIVTQVTYRFLAASGVFAALVGIIEILT